MTNLAIRGHKERGKEVIELLEMLGGKSYTAFPYQGNDIDRYYYINKVDNYINSETICSTLFPPKKFQIFILEDFLEKYPYKVGDKVKYINNIFCIKSSQWDNDKKTVIYYIDADWSAGYVVEANELQPYKEEIKEENKIFNEILDTLSSYLIDFMTPQGIDKCIKYIRENMDEYNKEEISEEIKIDIPKGYEFAGVDKQQVVFTRIQPEYPKTYEECCKVLSLGENGKLYTKGYKASLIQDLHKLLICRDAYWKIAGEQMGLGKPWEPDWNDGSEEKHCIEVRNDNELCEFTYLHAHRILAFPTMELLDIFGEYFKDLIEECKELL
jgi:hypothetical protein